MQLTDSYFQSSISHFFIRFIWEIKFSGLFISFLFFYFDPTVPNPNPKPNPVGDGTCPNFCPVLCQPGFLQCPGPIDSNGCKVIDNCIPIQVCYVIVVSCCFRWKTYFFLFYLVDVKALAAVDCKSYFGLRCKSSWCCWCCYSEV